MVDVQPMDDRWAMRIPEQGRRGINSVIKKEYTEEKHTNEMISAGCWRGAPRWSAAFSRDETAWYNRQCPLTLRDSRSQRKKDWAIHGQKQEPEPIRQKKADGQKHMIIPLDVRKWAAKPISRVLETFCRSESVWWIFGWLAARATLRGGSEGAPFRSLAESRGSNMHASWRHFIQLPSSSAKWTHQSRRGSIRAALQTRRLANRQHLLRAAETRHSSAATLVGDAKYAAIACHHVATVRYGVLDPRVHTLIQCHRRCPFRRMIRPRNRLLQTCRTASTSWKIWSWI